MTRIAKALFAIFVMVRDAAGNVARCGVSAARQNWERQLAAAGCPRTHAADVRDKVNSVLHGCQQAARIVESVCARSDTQCAGPVIARRVIIVVVASGPSCAMCVCVSVDHASSDESQKQSQDEPPLQLCPYADVRPWFVDASAVVTC